MMWHRTEMEEETGLNTVQLRHAMTENGMTKRHFNGVFPVDYLKFIKNPPTMVVVNTDPSSQPGKHWLLFFRTDSGVMEMFDSLGKDLKTYSHQIQDFAQRFDDTVKFVSRRIQPKNSALCGHYCLYYAYMRCAGSSMNDIIAEMPTADWIKECVPILFDIPGIISDCQTCQIF